MGSEGNSEGVKLASRSAVGGGGLSYVPTHGVFNRELKSVNFVPSPLGYEFHPTVIEVAHEAGYPEPRRRGLGRITKADPLNAAGEENPAANGP